jgi:hypothetical protein
MDDITITVSRSDLKMVLDRHNWAAESTNLGAAASRIRAAIPAPPWDPTDDQIERYLKVFAYTRNPEHLRDEKDRAARVLRELHRAGLLRD